MKVCLMTEARLMQRRIFAVVASLALAGAASANETVVLNNWYIRDFAKNTCEAAQGWQKENRSLIARVGCENVTSCPEMSLTVEACSGAVLPEVAAFELVLRTEFAANSACGGIDLWVFQGPEETNSGASQAAADHNHWGLLIDFVPGRLKQSWFMLHHANGQTAGGELDAKSIVRDVCAIVQGKGGRVHD